MRTETTCEICHAIIPLKWSGPEPSTCSARCRQAKCRNRKNEAGKGAAKAFTWEMIRAGNDGVIVKTDTPSGRRYLERKEIDKKRGRRVSQITSSVSHVPTATRDTQLGNRDTIRTA